MYKLMIVDDEEIICAGIKSMVESLKIPEISEIVVVYEGKDAIRLIHEIRPDIVLTDIRLNDITGLHMIKEVKKLAYNIQFIILSGYDDFNYAKEAIKLGVMDYLLKPASIEELEAVLNAAIHSSQKQKNLDEEGGDKYQKIVLENNLNKIFNNEYLTDAKIKSLLEELQFKFSYSHFCIGIVRFDEAISSRREMEAIDEIVSQTDEACLPRNEALLVNFTDYNSNLVLLFNCSDSCRYDTLYQYLGMLNQALIEFKRNYFLSALSDMGIDAGCIFSLYQQCRKALAYRIFFNPYDIIEFINVVSKSDGMNYPECELKELTGYMKDFEGNLDKISNYIDRLFTKTNLNHYSIKCIYKLYRYVLDTIGSIVTKEDQARNEAGLRDFNSFNTFGEIRIYLKEVLHKINELSKSQYNERTLVDIAKNYIKENIGKDINLTVVSNVVSMNYSYFSKLFKEQTGMNFSTFITMIRMDEAKKLLDDPLKRINEIAAKVGYPNPKHFTRAFKNYTGIPPKDYQKR